MSARISAIEACALLHCSTRQLQRFVDAGELTPIRDAPLGQHGRVWYADDQVRALSLRWKRTRRVAVRRSRMLTIPPETMRTVFQMLQAKHSLAAIVIETGLHPTNVRQLEEEYRTSFEEARRAKKRAADEADELAKQRAHDKAERDRVWREQQVQIAKLTGKAREKAG